MLPKIVLITQDARTKAFFDEIMLSPVTDARFDLLRGGFGALDASSRFTGDTLYIMAGQAIANGQVPDRSRPGKYITRRNLTANGAAGGGVTYGETTGADRFETADVRSLL